MDNATSSSRDAPVNPAISVDQLVDQFASAASSIQNHASESDAPSMVTSFDEMHLNEQLLRGIYDYGFEKPTMPQKMAIPPFSSGRDILAQVAAGTGRTATFAIGTLSRIDASSNHVQALILTPNREVCLSIATLIRELGKYMDARVLACFGGTSVRDSIQILRDNSSCPHAVVGTPGRIHDLMERHSLVTDTLKVVVLNEADAMLTHGFEEVVRAIFATIPRSAQVYISCATAPAEVMNFSNQFQCNPIRVLTKQEVLHFGGVRHFCLELRNDDEKREFLADALHGAHGFTPQSIVFTNTIEKAQYVARELKARGVAVSCIHSDLSSEAQVTEMREFRSGSSRALICTDIVHYIPHILDASVIINFDIPLEHDHYLHRVGRSCHFGRKTIAINLVAGGREAAMISDITKYFVIDIPALHPLEELRALMDHY